MQEIWKDIPSYEGLYQVSNLGRVKSLGNRYHRHNEILLKPKKDKYGYHIVTLYKNSRPKCYSIHRLVMMSFVGKSNLTVNHKNEIKTDNKLDNLEYMTNKDNVRYSQGHKIKATHINTEEILHFNSTKEVNEHGFSQGNVWACLKGKKKTHHNYRWEYESEVV